MVNSSKCTRPQFTQLFKITVLDYLKNHKKFVKKFYLYINGPFGLVKETGSVQNINLYLHGNGVLVVVLVMVDPFDHTVRNEALSH